MTVTIAQDLRGWRPISRLPGATALAIAEDGGGTLIVSTPTGLVTGRGDDPWRPLGGPAPLVETIVTPYSRTGEPATHGMWAGGLTGLYEWDHAAGTWNCLLDVASVTSICTGRDGKALVSTADDGVFSTIDGGAHWSSSSAGLTDLRVEALAALDADGRRVVAATCGGLHVSTNGGRSWRMVDAMPAPVNCVIVAFGQILAGTSDGLWMTDLDIATRLLATDSPVTQVCALDQRIAIAAGCDVWIRDPAAAEWLSVEALPSPCQDLRELGSGALIAATRRHGLRALDSKSRWQPYGPALPGAATGCLHGDGEALLWASADGGLQRSIDGGVSWDPIGPPDLHVNTVCAGDSGQGTLVATLSGLYELTEDSLRQLSDEPARACARLEDGRIIAAIADETGGSTLRQLDPSGRVDTVATLPAEVDRLYAWGPGLVAVTNAANAAENHRMVWRARRPEGPWQPVLSTPDRAPLLLAFDAGVGYVVVRDVLLRMDELRPGRPTPLGRLGQQSDEPERPVVAMDLAVARDGRLLAATSHGVWWSADQGQTWTSTGTHPTGHTMAVAATRDYLVAVDSDGCVWCLHQLGDPAERSTHS